MEPSGIMTTATSQVDGRMKVDAGGCSHGRKKCLKCAISKHKDGKGGPGVDAPGYGASKAQKTMATLPQKMTSKIHRSARVTGGLKMKGMKSISSSIKSLGKNMRFKKSSSKIKSFKQLVKTII